jgi:hypothetical protein
MLENNISILNLTPILLARYGILGKEAIYIRNAKWKDISFRNMEFLIYNKDRTEVVSTIPIDENFIEVMISIWKYEKQLYKGKKIRNKHIVKSQIIEEEMVNYNSLNSKVFRCFKDVNMKRISLKVLFNCAVIDYINKIYSKTIPRSNEELMKLLSIYYPDEKLTLEKLRVIKKLYGEAFDDTETLRTYGRVKNKNFSNTTRVFNRNNTRYTSEENYDFQLNKSKDTFKNEIIIEENYAYIILEGIIVEIKKVKINREIVDKVKDYKWHLNSSGNVITRKKIEGRLSIIHLSNLILNKEEYYRIKYINNDKLDCTIENLEVNGLY